MKTKRKIEAFIVLSFVAFVGTKGYLWANDTTLENEKNKVVERMSFYIEEKTNEAVSSAKAQVKKGYDTAFEKVGFGSNKETKENKNSLENVAKVNIDSPSSSSSKSESAKEKNQTSSLFSSDSQKNEISWHYTVKYKYDHTGAPDDISREKVMAILKKSSNIWERSCGVKFEYIGDMRSDYVNAEVDGTSGLAFGLIRWSDLSSDRLGQAHLGDKNGPVGDFIMDLNAKLFKSKRTQDNDLESTFTHELGHVLGLDHSRIPTSVMAGSSRAYTTMNELNAGDKEMCQSVVSQWEKNPRNKRFKI